MNRNTSASGASQPSVQPRPPKMAIASSPQPMTMPGSGPIRLIHARRNAAGFVSSPIATPPTSGSARMCTLR